MKNSARIFSAMKRVRSALFLVCFPALYVLAEGFSPAAAGDGGEKIVFEQYGFSFTCPAGWYFAQREAQGEKLFDVIRVSGAPDEAEDAQRHRRALSEALSARAYMLAYAREEIGSSELQFARRLAEDIRHQGFELITGKTGRENNSSVLNYTFRYRMPEQSRHPAERGQRDIWLSLRLVPAGKYVFALYGSCRSEKDLEMIAEIFAGIAFG